MQFCYAEECDGHVTMKTCAEYWTKVIFLSRRTLLKIKWLLYKYIMFVDLEVTHVYIGTCTRY